MKKFYTVFLIALLIIINACSRSQFSTTTRQIKNGKVTYTNHYQAERRIPSKGKPCKSHLVEKQAQNSTPASVSKDIRSSPETEISKINPVRFRDDENLIASTSNEPTIILAASSRIVPDGGLNVSQQRSGRPATVNYYPAPGSSKSTKYEAIRAPAKSRSKIEVCGLLGFICSILGWIPVIGILFAVAGVILSSVSLHKFNNYPRSYRGRGFAIAGLIIGIAALIFNLIYTITLISNLDFTINASLGGW